MVGLTGCKTPPKMEHYEFREFQRAPALIDMAVLDSSVLPNAVVEEYKGGDPVDYMGHGGRLIRVVNDTKKRLTRVMVSHQGFGGPAGAQRVLDRIEKWMDLTDEVIQHPEKFRDRLPKPKRRRRRF
jgi:hypothetical protein